MKEKIRIGVIGVGYMGRLHTLKYAAHPMAELIGVFDTDQKQAEKVANEAGVKAFAELDSLLALIDACSIATPTSSHFALASKCLQLGKHVLLEKPLAETVEEGEALLEMAQKQGVILAVGHLTRYHPAVVRLLQYGWGPASYLEAERLGPFKLRSLDVDVIADLMVHDLDLALLFLQGEPVDVRAIGVAVATDQIDIARAWIEFAKERVANIASSRISAKPNRKIRLFWHAHYASIDFFENTLLVSHKVGQTIKTENFHFEAPDLLYDEIDSFLSASESGEIFCTAEEACRVLALAQRISHAAKKNTHA